MVPLCDLQIQYRQLQTEIDEAMRAVASAGHYILGPQVKAFEQELAAFCGCRFAAGVANGTDALHLALRALRIGPGDEVITTPFTFVATTEAIGLVGATPVFVDICPATFNLDVQQVAEAITPRTKALLPVHLYGQPCEMQDLLSLAREHRLYIIEDAAQALGARYRGKAAGTIGDIGCYSFFPSKNLGCFGDGGMVVTNDPELFERVEMLRRHGGKVKYHHEELGLNSRLDELQAAILRIKLPHLATWNRARRQHALRYNQWLADVPNVGLPAERTERGAEVFASQGLRQNPLLESVYHQYTIRVRDREAVMQQLSAREIGHAIYYPVPLHLQRVHAGLRQGPGSFPHAERAARECLSLPMFPELSTRQQADVVDTLRSVAARRAA